MNLLKTYLKLILIKNRMGFLLVTLSTMAGFVAIAVLTVYIDNVLILSSDYYPGFRYLYLSIRTLFIIAGIFFIIGQYYNIMKTGMKDYLILKSLGATGGDMRKLIFLKGMILILIILPLGLYGGFSLTSLIMKCLSSFSVDHGAEKLLNSTNTFITAAIAGCCIIAAIGIYLDQGVRKMPLTSHLTEGSAVEDRIKNKVK